MDKGVRAAQGSPGGGRSLTKEIVVSYLFSNSQLLQEESAMVIRAINREWYTEVEGGCRNR